MKVFAELNARGFIKDKTWTAQPSGEINAYIGFDLTAPSLHVGSLIQLMVLRWLVMAGHKPIVLLGEATTRIGDPSGRDTSRPMLDAETIEKNRIGITLVIDRIVGNVKIVSNAEWFNSKGPSLMDFMAEFGPHFTINRMLGFDSVKSRLNRQQPLTMLEFSYMLFQAVDFRELRQRHGTTMQIGGSDQWGNIINGVDLIRRMDNETVQAFTTPLLLDSQGNKMGKSQGKPIWLDADLTSPFDFFQYWRNCADEDAKRFYLMFTDVSRSSIKAMFATDPFPDGPGEHMNINTIKKALAFDVTCIVHGREAAKMALDQSTEIFEKQVAVAVRTVSARFDETIASYMVIAGLAPSKGAAKRLVWGNGVMIDGELVSDPMKAIPRLGVIRVGKQAPVQIVGEK